MSTEKNDMLENEDSELQEEKPVEDNLDLKKKADSQAIWKEVFSWVRLIVCTCVVVLLLNRFVITNAVIPSESMEDTIQVHDRLIGFRLSYLFSDPERGDIIMFKFPDNEEETYIKRVIGLPGETVTIREGKVYVDGDELIEDYIKEPMDIEKDMEFEVPEDSYFMLGDNRNISSDARYWDNTYLKKDKIIAKAIFRYYPNLELLN